MVVGVRANNQSNPVRRHPRQPPFVYIWTLRTVWCRMMGMMVQMVKKKRMWRRRKIWHCISNTHPVTYIQKGPHGSTTTRARIRFEFPKSMDLNTIICHYICLLTTIDALHHRNILFSSHPVPFIYPSTGVLKRSQIQSDEAIVWDKISLLTLLHE